MKGSPPIISPFTVYLGPVNNSSHYIICLFKTKETHELLGVVESFSIANQLTAFFFNSIMSFPAVRHPKQDLFDSIGIHITLASADHKSNQTFVITFNLKEENGKSWKVSHSFNNFKDLHKSINTHAPGFIFTEFPPSHHKTGLGLKLTEKQMHQRLTYLVQWFREVIANFDLFPPLIQEMLVRFIDAPTDLKPSRSRNNSEDVGGGVYQDNGNFSLGVPLKSALSVRSRSPSGATDGTNADSVGASSSGGELKGTAIDIKNGVAPISLSSSSNISRPAVPLPPLKVIKVSSHFNKIHPLLDKLRVLLTGNKHSDVSVVCISVTNRVVTSSSKTMLGDFVSALKQSPVRYFLLAIVVLLLGSSAHSWADRSVCLRLWGLGLVTSIAIWYTEQVSVTEYNQYVIDKLGIRDNANAGTYPYTQFYHKIPHARGNDSGENTYMSTARIQAMLRSYLREPSLTFVEYVTPLPVAGNERQMLQQVVVGHNNYHGQSSGSRPTTPTHAATVAHQTSSSSLTKKASLSSMVKHAFGRKQSKQTMALRSNPNSSDDLINMEKEGHMRPTTPRSSGEYDAVPAGAGNASNTSTSASAASVNPDSQTSSSSSAADIATLASASASASAADSELKVMLDKLSAEERAAWFVNARKEFEAFKNNLSEKANDMYRDRRYDHNVTVRGQNYMEDQKKINGGSAICKFMLMELYEVEPRHGDRHDHIASRGRAKKRVESIAQLPGRPFQLVLNFQIPGDPAVSMVCYFAIPPDIREPGYEDGSTNDKHKASSTARAGKELDRFLSLLDRFLDVPATENERLAAWGVQPKQERQKAGGEEGGANSDGAISRTTSVDKASHGSQQNGEDNDSADDSLSDSGAASAAATGSGGGGWYKMPSDITWPTAYEKGALPPEDFRNQRFKLIPAITEGPWVVRAAVRSKPALLGRKIVQRYFRGDGYVEIDFDVGSSLIASQIVGVCRGYGKLFVCDVGVVIQGEEAYELPEKMLCCGAFNKVDMDVRIKLEDDE